MSGGHAHLLYVHGDSPLHRLPAHVKLVTLVLTVFAVVALPREQVWAYVLLAAVIGVLVRVARLGARRFLSRLLIETPFVAFASFLPFVARGRRVDVLGVDLSVEGLWGAWELVATGTLGVACSVLLASTTSMRELLSGLERLRLPTVVVQIMSFMVRYADVVSDELSRMRIARESRGFEARSIRHWPVLARAAGALFVRCFERGERIHLAMVSRGYTGRLPRPEGAGATAGQWAVSLMLPIAAFAVCLAAWVVMWTR